MPLPKRTVTKTKKDGVKKKTVTYKSNAGTVTRTKTKSKAGKGKTTTVSSKKGKVVGTASKAKTRGATEKNKSVALGKGRLASTSKGKGRAYSGKDTRRTLSSGGSGDAVARTTKGKYRTLNPSISKTKSTSSGTSKNVVYKSGSYKSRGEMPSYMSSRQEYRGMKTSDKRGRFSKKKKRSY